MKIAEGWKGGSFHPSARFWPHKIENGNALTCVNTTTVQSQVRARPQVGVEVSTLPPLTCPRCGWRVDQLGHEINCVASAVIGRADVFLTRDHKVGKLPSDAGVRITQTYWPGDVELPTLGDN
jgi:hypothetical protein